MNSPTVPAVIIRQGNLETRITDDLCFCGKGKVKKVNFTLQQATRSRSGVEVLFYSFFNLGARWGGWSTPRRGRFTPEKDPVPIVYEAR
jgi:hypothetical protein